MKEKIRSVNQDSDCLDLDSDVASEDCQHLC